MDLQLTPHQKQILTQNMLLSINILQMNSYELKQYMQKEALENPMIEMEETQISEDIKNERIKKLEWLDSLDESRYYRYSYNYDAEETALPIYENKPAEDLSEALISQISGFQLDTKTEAIVRFLIKNLDDNGYFTLSRERLFADFQINEERLNTALEILWQMDPPGVGAFDLRQCLLIQAKRQNPPSDMLITIIEKHLDALANNQLIKIAKEQDISIDTVKEMRGRLLSLNPKPGNGYSSYNAIPYIRPDLFVIHFENALQVILNDYEQPKIIISDQYRSFAKYEDAAVGQYVHERLRKAEWLVSCIEHRKKTILRCAEKILLWQMRFFENGPGYIAPMTLSDIAAQLGLHPSTVSRAVDGKYLQCQWGIFRLDDFFSWAVGKDQKQSQESISAFLKRLIENEDKTNPLSDQKLTELLRKSDIAVARRTIAKYREQMQIPAAKLRKKY